MIAPSIRRPFEWVSTPAGTSLVCRPLAEVAVHAFTTREWALGSGTTAADDQGCWGSVARAVGLDASRLARVRQVHGAAVAVGQPGIEEMAEMTAADIVLTADSSSAVAVQTADCVPLLIADERSGAVVAAHAGWRGLAARVPAVAVDALCEHVGASTGDLIAAIGPSIGACCYEVGVDVRGRFVSEGFAPEDIRSWFQRRPASLPENPPMTGLAPHDDRDHWFFDGWAAARDQLMMAGVRADRLFVAGACSASHALFCSFRRDGAGAGRMAAVIRPGRRRP
jgi:YfiH family protein